MSHKVVYEKFKELFNIEECDVDTWFQNGKNSIRVRNVNKVVFVFSYEDDRDWCLETEASYINKMRAGFIKYQEER